MFVFLFFVLDYILIRKNDVGTRLLLRGLNDWCSWNSLGTYPFRDYSSILLIVGVVLLVFGVAFLWRASVEKKQNRTGSFEESK